MRNFKKGFSCVAGNSGIRGGESWRLVLYFFRVYLSLSTEESICYVDLIFVSNYLSSQKYSAKRLFGFFPPFFMIIYITILPKSNTNNQNRYGKSLETLSVYNTIHKFSC